MPTEHINYDDVLREGTDKLNKAIDQANKAEVDSEEALNTANQALSNSESTQTQLDTIVIEGDSSVEAAQARVNADGSVTYDTLKDRLDTEYIEVHEQLADISVNVKNFGAVGDGIADDTTAIQNAIASLANGGIVLFPKGVYLFSSIELNGVANIHLYGNNAILKPTDGTFPFQITGNSEKVTIDSIVFDGENITLESNGHLLTIRESNHTLIKNCTFKNLRYGTSGLNGNDGIYIRSTLSTVGTHIKNVTIRECQFYDISRQGISIIQGEKILIEGCYFSPRRSAVDIEPNNDYELTTGVIVKNCFIDGERPTLIHNTDTGVDDTQAIMSFSLETEGLALDPSNLLIENVMFSDNVIIGNGEGGGFIQFSRTKNASCKNNIMKNVHPKADTEAIILAKARSENIIITGNIIEGYGDIYALRAYGTKNIIISDNIVKNGLGSGLILSTNVEQSEVVNNQFIDCGTNAVDNVVTFDSVNGSLANNKIVDTRAAVEIPATAIYANGERDKIVKDNVIDGAFENGISTGTSASSTERTYDLSITSNVIKKATTGIQSHYTYKQTISLNRFINVVGVCIDLEKTDFNIISGNHIFDSSSGASAIRAFAGKGNKINDNTIVDMRTGTNRCDIGVQTNGQTNSIAKNNHSLGVQTGNSFDAGTITADNIVDTTEQTFTTQSD